MAEYIEREALMKYADTQPGGLISNKSIQFFQAVDVAPVRHGWWERTADGAALCTACKRKMNPSQYGYAFCSLCGAKMDGELNE